MLLFNQTRRNKMKEIETIEGLMSYEECKEAIRFHAINIAKSDDSSLLANNARVDTLRRLLKLYSRYLSKISEE